MDNKSNIRNQIVRSKVQFTTHSPPRWPDMVNRSNKVITQIKILTQFSLSLYPVTRVQVFNQSSLSSNIHTFLRSSPCWAATRFDCLCGWERVPAPFSSASLSVGGSSLGLTIFELVLFAAVVSELSEGLFNSRGYSNWISRHNCSGRPSLVVVFTIAAL